MTLEEIVKELVHAGIIVEMSLNRVTGDIEYDLNVHLNSGIKLIESIDGEIVAITRYNSKIIEGIEELLRLYLYWFEDAQERWGNCIMDVDWESLMIKHGVIQVESQTQRLLVKPTSELRVTSG